MTQIDGDKLAGYNNLGGVVGGGVYSDLSDKWRASLAIAYSQQGSSATSKEFELSIYDKIALDYVAVPVTVHFMDWLSDDEFYYRLEFCAGLEYRRLIRTKVIDNTGQDLTNTLDYKENVVAATLGAYYNINAGWAAGFFFARSLTDIQEDPLEQNQFAKHLSLQLRYTL